MNANTGNRGEVAVIALVGYAHAVSHFFHLMIPPLFPWLMKDFDLSFTEAGFLMTVFFVVSGTGQALAGFVVDRIGARPVLFSGVLMLVLSGIALGVAQNYPMLMLAAALAGAGNSVFHPADFTLLNHRVSLPRLGHAFSVHGLSGNLGWAAAPFLMTSVAVFAGWRMAGFAAALVGLAALLMLYVGRDYLKVTPAAAVSDSEAVSAGPATGFLRSGVVWLCFLFFLLSTSAFGALQNYSTASLQNIYALSLAGAASCLIAYLLGGAGGIAVGGFIATRHAQDRIIAIGLSTGAAIGLLLAAGVVPGWAVLPLMAVMGACVGIAGPSRDLLVRKAATHGLGKASFGRVYGFVYSGLDVGLAIAPLIFGPLMDGGHFNALWVGVALLQGLAVVSALRVGRDAR
jgi:FSR family fosmidomycin resistance protein-like MFS transporter